MSKITLVKSKQPDSSKYDLDIVCLNDVKIGYVGHPNRIDHTHYIFIAPNDDRFSQFENMQLASKEQLVNMLQDFCCQHTIH